MNVRTSKQGTATITISFDISSVEELNKIMRSSDRLRVFWRQLREKIMNSKVTHILAENCWFLANEDTKEAVVIDPGAEPDGICAAAEKHGWKIIDPAMDISTIWDPGEKQDKPVVQK